jgi:hypothetical protein
LVELRAAITIERVSLSVVGLQARTLVADMPLRIARTLRWQAGSRPPLLEMMIAAQAKSFPVASAVLALALEYWHRDRFGE